MLHIPQIADGHLIVVIHEHEYGHSVYTLRIRSDGKTDLYLDIDEDGNMSPQQAAIVEFLEIDFEPAKDEYLYFETTGDEILDFDLPPWEKV